MASTNYPDQKSQASITLTYDQPLLLNSSGEDWNAHDTDYQRRLAIVSQKGIPEFLGVTSHFWVVCQCFAIKAPLLRFFLTALQQSLSLYWRRFPFRAIPRFRREPDQDGTDTPGKTAISKSKGFGNIGPHNSSSSEIPRWCFPG